MKKPALWKRLLAAVLSPLVFLVLIELVLTVTGYGRPRGFFIPWKTVEGKVYLSNAHYCEHFVPNELSRAPEKCALDAKKQRSTVRIFVLGGSAAYGDPEPAYGFCRQLEVLLSAQAPQTSFEIVNAAVTSMNSHVARRIAQDCAAHQPDLFIVYMGNNEVVGPYGPPTLPAGLYASGAFIDAAIAAKKETRIGQLVANVAVRARAPKGVERKWLGMEAFLTSQIARADAKMQSCYRHFSRNLRAIVRTAQRSGAKTLLCTVPTNLRNCAPFASQHKNGLNADSLAEWDRCFDAGRDLELAGDFDAALEQYEQARKIDDGYAELAYCMGNCLYVLGRTDEAKAKYTQARDLDTLRFRADSSINAAIRQAAKDLAGRGAVLLDLESCLEDRAKDGLLDASFLVDHVHLNFGGNFVAAYAAAQAIADLLPQAGLSGVGRSERDLYDLCRKRLVYTAQEKYRLAMVMYRRKTLPPFAGQLGHEKELEAMREELFALRRTMKGQNEPEADYVGALGEAPLDSYLTVRYGDSLVTAGHLRDAIELYRKVLDAQPFSMKVREALAQALARGGMQNEAVKTVTSDLTPYRYSRKEALLMLGTYYVKAGMIAEAQAVYQELNEIDPENVDVLVNLAAAASHARDFDAMKRYLDKALKIAPDSVQATINMGNFYAKKNQPAVAQQWFAKAVERDPQSELAHIGLGIQSLLLEQMDKGAEHVARAAELKPDFFEAYQLLAALCAQAGQPEKARKYAELVALFQP
ncbi:MAG: tetratricopeptide repeat protein [Sedimentisphaerales bacterium]|nr:tetratricopeptide repeat protein [Sedimentisphaerales bacterium]